MNNDLRTQPSRALICIVHNKSLRVLRVLCEKPLRPAPFRIGIAWQGKPHHKGDRQRSVPVAELAALSWIPGVELISLQKGPGVEQLRGIAGRFAAVALHGE